MERRWKDKIYLWWNTSAYFIFVTPRRLLKKIGRRVRPDSGSAVAKFCFLSDCLLEHSTPGGSTTQPLTSLWIVVK
jgi:hypothetical protein